VSPPFVPPRTPSTGASTDGGLPERSVFPCAKRPWLACRLSCKPIDVPSLCDANVGWTSPTATGGTITPPDPPAPAAEPHPADHRLLAAERAFLTASRLELQAADWRQYGLDQIRKARAGQ